MQRIQIIPAVMPKDIYDLELHMSAVKGLVDMVQIDVMDGQYVEHKTWPYIIEDDPTFISIVRQEEGLPLWENIDIEVDLMVKDVEKEFDRWIAAGASRVVVHYNSLTEERLVAVLDSGTERGVDMILGISLDDDIEKVLSFIIRYPNSISAIQCMGIKRVGYTSEPFDIRVIDFIKKIKASDSIVSEKNISVDGGVNFDTAKVLVDSGATRLVSQSTIFESKDIREAVTKLKELVKNVL